MAAKTYRDLLVWRRAMDLVVEVYRVTAGFPRDELFGLTGQVRRAAISVPSNLAEGQGRGAGKDFLRYARIAQGSLQEIETQLLIGDRLGYSRDSDNQTLFRLCDEVGRLNRGLCKSLQ